MRRERYRPLDFFGITPQKITPVFTSSPRDSHPNTIKNVTAPLYPSLYIQPNTLDILVGIMLSQKIVPVFTSPRMTLIQTLKFSKL
jgi:hypothetical protein